MTDQGTEVAEPGTEVVPASEGNGALVAPGDRAPVLDEAEQHHPTPRQYVLIAVVLVVITGVEIATSYIDTAHSNLIIAALFLMGFVKFFLVCRVVHAHEDRPAVLPAGLRRGDRRRHDRLRHRPAGVLEHRAEGVGRRDRRRFPSRLAAAPRCVAPDRAVRRRLRGRDQPVGSPSGAAGRAGRHAFPNRVPSPRACSRCGSRPTGRSTMSPSAISSRCTWSSTLRTRSSRRRSC